MNVQINFKDMLNEILAVINKDKKHPYEYEINFYEMQDGRKFVEFNMMQDWSKVYRVRKDYLASDDASNHEYDILKAAFCHLIQDGIEKFVYAF